MWLAGRFKSLGFPPVALSAPECAGLAEADVSDQRLAAVRSRGYSDPLPGGWLGFQVVFHHAPHQTSELPGRDCWAATGSTHGSATKPGSSAGLVSATNERSGVVGHSPDASVSDRPEKPRARRLPLDSLKSRRRLALLAALFPSVYKCSHRIRLGGVDRLPEVRPGDNCSPPRWSMDCTGFLNS